MSLEAGEKNDGAIDEFGSPGLTVLMGFGVGRGFDDGLFVVPLVAI
jgi:hypothetical protein